MTGHLRGINYYLIGIILFHNVFPVKPIMGMPVAPENLFYFLGMILVLYNFKHDPPRDRTIIRVIFLFAIFHLAVFLVFFMFIPRESYPLFKPFKNVLFFLLVLQVTEERDYISLLRFYLFLLSLEAVLSLLALYVGGVFQSIFNLFAVDPEADQTLFMKGRLAGFTGKIFLFAYPLSVMPILALTFYKVSRKNHYLFLFFLAVFALILNGERAALVFCMAIVVFLMTRWFKRNRKLVVLAMLTILAFSAFNQVLMKAEVRHAILRLRDSSSDEIQWRLAKQAAMVIVVLRHPIEGGQKNIEEYRGLFRSWSGFYPTQPHNAYINMGMYAGVFGWIILAIFIASMRRIKRRVDRMKTQRQPLSIFVEGNFWALMAVMSVSLFHNAGLFDGERSAVILLGLLFSVTNRKKRLNSGIIEKEMGNLSLGKPPIKSMPEIGPVGAGRGGRYL